MSLDKNKETRVTPLMKQYNSIKAKYPDALLLFRVGDFYETFGSDAYEWDGRDYDGRNLAEGVYYYVLSSQGLDNELYSEKGSITLLR